MVARYDTFSDVILTVLLCQSDPIYFVEFDTLIHKRIYLPCALHYIALFSLIVGVFALQALPGIGILFFVDRFPKYLPAAFKFNEFNFLLGMLELEEQGDRIADESTLVLDGDESGRMSYARSNERDLRVLAPSEEFSL